MYVTEQMLLSEHTDLSPYARCKTKFKSCIIKSYMTRKQKFIRFFLHCSISYPEIGHENQLENNVFNHVMQANNAPFPLNNWTNRLWQYYSLCK